MGSNPTSVNFFFEHTEFYVDITYITGDLMLVKDVGEICMLVKNRYVGEECSSKSRSKK